MNFIVEHFEMWLGVALIGILTVFSDKIIGRIRFALNRADLRSQYYEQLALDLSTFVFYADLFQVRHIRHEANSKSMGGVIDEVNGAYVTLKTKEYVYRSWVRRYWSDDGVKRFESVMLSATKVYESIIEFNKEGKEAQKTEALSKCLAELKTNADRWLSELDA